MGEGYVEAGCVRGRGRLGLGSLKAHFIVLSPPPPPPHSGSEPYKKGGHALSRD